MNTIRKIFAVLCAVLFAITGAVALLLFNIDRMAFSPETFKQAFESRNLYERMPAILANALQSSIARNENADPYLKVLSVDDLEKSISILLPPEELKALANDTLDSAFRYLNDQSDSVTLSLLPLKKHLTGPEGADVVKQIIQAQPDCTAEQIVQIGMGVLTGNIALCKPPQEMLGLVAPLIESQLQSVTATIPEEVTLIANTKSGMTEDPRLKLNTIRKFMKFSLLLPAFWLIVILGMIVRSFTDWLNWWGWPLFIMGALAAITAMIGKSLLGLFIQTVMQNQGLRSMPPILLSTLQEMINAVALQILKPVIIEGAVLGVLGLGMIFAAYLIIRFDVQINDGRFEWS